MVVVPEIDVPGHVNAALVAYPELALPGYDAKPYTGTDVGFSTLDPANERVYEFVDDVVRELAGLTPEPYLHIGGDEVFKIPAEEYVRFVERACEIVRSHGKRPIGWEEIAKTRLHPDTIVQHWKEPELAARAGEQGASVIMSPGSQDVLRPQVRRDVEARHGVGGTHQRPQRVRLGSRRRARRRGHPLVGDARQPERRRVHGVSAAPRARRGRVDAAARPRLGRLSRAARGARPRVGRTRRQLLPLVRDRLGLTLSASRRRRSRPTVGRAGASSAAACSSSRPTSGRSASLGQASPRASRPCPPARSSSSAGRSRFRFL